MFLVESSRNSVAELPKLFIKVCKGVKQLKNTLLKELYPINLNKSFQMINDKILF